ncbi:MAG: hypothetical protein FJ290_11160 [Planctomycetes bacterium]|nr:hypothetical protein [Planctomycetota bacterium]
MNMAKKMKKIVSVASIVLATGLLVTAGCRSSTSDGQNAQADSLPQGLFVSQPPEGAVDLDDALKPGGDQVVVRARVAGRRDPFVAGRAAMVVADLKFPTCDTRPGDTCPTPWDFCCEAPAGIAEHTALVQVVGSDGKPLQTPLQRANGLAPMSVVVVKGTIVRGPDGKGAIINAEQIHVGPGGAVAVPAAKSGCSSGCEH